MPASPLVDTRVFPYIQDTVKRLESELAAVTALLQKKGLPISIAASGGMGSGFLPHVQAAIDLDYLVLWDIGTVKQEDPEAAHQILSRIESILRALVWHGRRIADAELTFLGINGLDNKGRFFQKDQALLSLSQALRRPSTKEKIPVILLDQKKRPVPWILPANEVVLTEAPDAAFLSNRIRFREESFPAIRMVEVQFHFLIHLEQQNGEKLNLLLEPLVRPKGYPIRLRWYFPLFTAFSSPISLKNFRKIVEKDIPKESMRLDTIFRVLAAAEAHVQEDRIHKAIKRVHQLQLILEKALPEPERQALNEDIQRWLSSPAAIVFDDLAEFAYRMKFILKRPKIPHIPNALEIFHASGDIERSVRTYKSKSLEALPSFPHQEKKIQKLIALLEGAGGFSSIQNEIKLWERLETSAKVLVREIGPSAEEILDRLKKLKYPLLQAGFSFVPIIGASEEKGLIYVRREDLLSLNVSVESLKKIKLEGLRFEFLETVPENPPVRHFPLRIDATPEQDRYYRKLLSLLP